MTGGYRVRLSRLGTFVLPQTAEVMRTTVCATFPRR